MTCRAGDSFSKNRSIIFKIYFHFDSKEIQNRKNFTWKGIERQANPYLKFVLDKKSLMTAVYACVWELVSRFS